MKKDWFNEEPVFVVFYCKLFQLGMFQVMLLGHPASIIAYLTFAAFPPFAVIVTPVSLLHSENAIFPMLVTLSGIVTIVILSQ